MPKKHRRYSPKPESLRQPQTPRRAIFEDCQHVSISGGTFNVQAGIPDVYEPDFRRVRLGDLKLVKEVSTQDIVEGREILHKRTGVVKRRVSEVVGVRKVHHARVVGFQEDFTAVVYVGSNFEKHRTHAEDREQFRHPSLVQLFGVTSNTRLNALIYNDGMIPVAEFEKMYNHSPLAAAYARNELARHLHAALQRWEQVAGQWLIGQDPKGLWNRLRRGTLLWFRVSTGQLCIEVTDTGERDPTGLPGLSSGGSISEVSLPFDTNLEDNLLSNMALDDIHDLFSTSVSVHWVQIDEPDTVLFPSLCWPTLDCTSRFNPFCGISLSERPGSGVVHALYWRYFRPNERSVILPKGSRRVALSDLPSRGECQLRGNMGLKWTGEQKLRKVWLSQANHVMNKWGLRSDHFYLLTSLAICFTISSSVDEFTLGGTFMADALRDEIYLFFSVQVDDSDGHLTVHLPLKDQAHYWSFHPDGLDRLPQEVVDDLALPRVSFQATAFGRKWSQEVYDAIVDFHRTKGFDPTSQDVAIELGYPLINVGKRS